jgi:superoxide dismutase, Fe-Mn family
MHSMNKPSLADDSGVTRRDLMALAGFAGGVTLASSVLVPSALAQTGLPEPKFPPKREQPFQLGGFEEGKGGGGGGGAYVLPALPYAVKDLEPHIDAKTVELHHGKHHQVYVDGANRAVRALADIRDGGDVSLVRHWARELSFHLGGHVNHTLFWNMMAPPSKKGGPRLGGGEPQGALRDAISRDFGSLEKFVAHFEANAVQVEGGGWGWLVFDTLSKRLLLIQMESQQDRFVAGAVPILGVDVWEHAYYLKYENRRLEYVKAFGNVIHWRFCEWLYERAMAGA